MLRRTLRVVGGAEVVVVVVFVDVVVVVVAAAVIEGVGEPTGEAIVCVADVKCGATSVVVANGSANVAIEFDSAAGE